MTNHDAVTKVREVRERLRQDGPAWSRPYDRDFARVALPADAGDLLRDLLIAAKAATVVEIGLAYGSSALAIGEALVRTADPRHVVIDPYQESAYADVGWNALREAGLDAFTTLHRTASSLALPKLITEGLVADAAFVDGSHRFHEVFTDLYFLRKIVRPGGLILLDDSTKPSVRTALNYYEKNLGWTVDQAVNPRCIAMRLPDPSFEPNFEDFQPFHG